MKQAEFANEPDIPMAIFNDMIDPPNKPPCVVIAVMSKGFGFRVEPVDAAIFAQPQIAATVAGNAPDGVAPEAVGVLGVRKVSRASFGCGVKSVYAGMGNNPQITMIVFNQIPNEIVTEAPWIIGVVFEYDEGVAVIAVKPFSGSKPHEAPAVLQNRNNVVLSQAIACGQVGKLKVSGLRIAPITIGLRPQAAACGQACGLCIFDLGQSRFAWPRFNWRGIPSDAEKQNPARAPQAWHRIWANRAHAFPAKFCVGREPFGAVL